MRLLLLILALLPVAAGAADWVPVSTVAGGDRYYYDRSKLYLNSDEITYWKKVQFLSPHPVNNQLATSGLLRERINCAQHTLKLISYLFYDAQGRTVEYVADVPGDASPIIPDTLGDVFEKTMCRLVREKQRADAAKKLAEEEKRRAEAAAACELPPSCQKKTHADVPAPPATAATPATAEGNTGVTPDTTAPDAVTPPLPPTKSQTNAPPAGRDDPPKN